ISDTDVVNGKTYLAIKDGNFNIVGYVDAATGILVASYEYDSFGRIVCRSGIKADDFNFRFASYQFDAETGLVYYGYRYYNPETGRWLSRDPITEAGGKNLYAFVGNEPTNYIDKLGLALYAFDGTGNDMTQVGDPNSPLDSGLSNIAILFNAYNGKGWYLPGVGTQGKADITWGGITGWGGDYRVNEMYNKFLEFYRAGDTDIDIIGFSRGAALARAFANKIAKDGVPYTYQSSTTEIGPFEIDLPSKKTGKACPRIRFLGLFDTVASFGLPGNNINLGKDIGIPDIVDYTAHATAMDELRRKFPLSSITSPEEKIDLSRKIEMSFRGAHADIGGGYTDFPEASYKPLEWMRQQGISHGVPFGSLPSSIRDFLNSPRGKADRVYIHDSRAKGLYYEDNYINAVLGERQIFWNK
ncbi:MAG: DUF2235 domain-containing protein, partial [Victivallales bacterium]